LVVLESTNIAPTSDDEIPGITAAELVVRAKRGGALGAQKGEGGASSERVGTHQQTPC
jgi:hypothetical protein